jgi:hypothetical protein
MPAATERHQVRPIKFERRAAPLKSIARGRAWLNESGHFAMRETCPPYPRKRTFDGASTTTFGCPFLRVHALAQNQSILALARWLGSKTHKTHKSHKADLAKLGKSWPCQGYVNRNRT